MCGYGDVGKVCTFALVGSGARVFVGEGHPFCALQACLESFQVAAIETAVSGTDIFAFSTCNFDVCTLDHMKMTKNSALVGNTGHFVNEIDLVGTEGFQGTKVGNIKPLSPLVTV